MRILFGLGLMLVVIGLLTVAALWLTDRIEAWLARSSMVRADALSKASNFLMRQISEDGP